MAGAEADMLPKATLSLLRSHPSATQWVLAVQEAMYQPAIVMGTRMPKDLRAVALSLVAYQEEEVGDHCELWCLLFLPQDQEDQHQGVILIRREEPAAHIQAVRVEQEAHQEAVQVVQVVPGVTLQVLVNLVAVDLLLLHMCLLSKLAQFKLALTPTGDWYNLVDITRWL